MKYLIAAALSFTTTAHARPIADARLHVLEQGKWVMTDEAAPPNIKLHPVRGATEAYVVPMGAEATDLATPRVFTVLGDTESCRVETTKRMFVAPHPGAKPKVAIELDTAACKLGSALLAIDGTTDATASLVVGTQAQASTRVAEWVEHVSGKIVLLDWQHEPQAYLLSISDEVAIIYTAFKAGGNGMFVRRDDTALAHFENGTALAILHDDHDRLVVQTPTGLRTVTL